MIAIMKALTRTSIEFAAQISLLEVACRIDHIYFQMKRNKLNKIIYYLINRS